ncbi:MAG: preprotein translocase subunit SecE, partial [Anaerolineales bacterium]|nr:preprotein translocase subunit SecE [Anaerolineales bacterium]
VSKTVGCGFDSCLACLIPGRRRLHGRRFVRKNDAQCRWASDSPECLISKEAIVAKASKSKSSGRKQSNAIQRYIRETIGELRKVNWPTRKEATNLTIVVIIVLIAMGAFLGVLDLLFTRFFALILL